MNSKVVILNSNFCYQTNWEILTQFTDPGNMLKWLEDELDSIERANGTAIILTHVPNNDECGRQIGLRWHALMDRYQHIVRFGVAGHIHKQQWQV